MKLLDRKFIIFHPYVISVSPVLYLYLNNLALVPPSDILRPMVLSLTIALLVFLLSGLLFKDSLKAGVFTSLLMFLLFSYGWLYQGVSVIPFDTKALLGKKVLLNTIYFIFIFSIFLLIKSSRREFSRENIFLNVMSILLFVLFVPRIINNNPFQTVNFSLIRDSLELEFKLEEPDYARDIYYIVLDGHTRSDILYDVFNVSNAEFLSELSDMGFYIVGRSNANYAQTYLSINSTLNMQYLDEIVDDLGTDNYERLPLIKGLSDNEVMEKLGEVGYDVFILGPGWAGLPYKTIFSDSKEMKLLETHKTMSWFERNLLNTTPLMHTPEEACERYRSFFRILFRKMNTLISESNNSSPKFVYLHILSPHPPFVFDAEGNDLQVNNEFCDGNDGSGYKGSKEDYILGYSEQIQYVEIRTLSLVKDILKSTEIEPIIIIQGDHGSGYKTNWENVDETDLQERMGILSAYYLPNSKDDDLYESITPVNTFRYIFNEYFSTELELLEDKNYFSTWSKPYLFIDVTEQVN